MSSPFVFTPSGPVQPELQPSPYLFQYYNPPRISPYIPTLPLDLSAPNTPTQQVRFLDDDRWSAPQPRPRRPSWHAGMSAPNLGVPPGYGSSSVPFQTYALPLEHHARRRSFDSRLYQQPTAPEYYPPTAGANPWLIPSGYTYPVRSQIHPLLSGLGGETRILSILFDLSAPTFNPLQIIGAGRTTPISPQELAQPATNPPTTRLTITCNFIPQWPIYLDYNAATAAASGGYLRISPPAAVPITLGDVLYSIHTSLQTQVTHLDWARLSDSESKAIARAYTRRCRASPSMESHLASQGVRRVDYLLKTFVFAGLVREPGDDGFDNLSLMVTSR